MKKMLLSALAVILWLAMPAACADDEVEPDPIVTTIKGDMNENGQIDTGDLVLYMQYLCGEAAAGEADTDVNDDGVSDLTDLVCLMRHLANTHPG